MTTSSTKSEKSAGDKKPEEKSEAKAAASTASSGGKIYDNVWKAVGGTPLVRMPRFSRKYKIETDLVAKLEFINPMASVKDRNCLAIIEEAESSGQIKPDATVLIEASAGSSALTLAAIATAKGYPLTVIMPESTSLHIRKLLNLFGAEVILTPADHGMKGAAAKAKELISASKKPAFSLQQFENPAASHVHEKTTAEELWSDTGGKLDILVVSVGTGSTIMGLAKALKKRKENLKIYAVEPAESAVLSGEKKLVQHGIEGMGAGFVPKIVDLKAIDGILKVTTEKAMEIARDAARLEGIPCCPSGGAALAGALQISEAQENKGKTVAVIIPSSAERYTHTKLFEPIKRL